MQVVVQTISLHSIQNYKLVMFCGHGNKLLHIRYKCWFTISVLWCCLHLFMSFFTAMIGLLYPCIDSRLGEPHKFKREWSSVMRCVAVFVGINHASAVSLSCFCKLLDSSVYSDISMLFCTRGYADQIRVWEPQRLRHFEWPKIDLSISVKLELWAAEII